MRRVLFKAAVVALACVCIKVAFSIVIVPMMGGTLDPINWIWFLISPMLVAMPAATYLFWKDEQLARCLVALKRAHADLDRKHKRLGEEARRDAMTGFLNRESFFEAVDHARETTDAGTFLVIDADQFKRINDTHGHMTGDAALVEMTAAIRRSIRDRDITGRIGGEEFGVFLADIVGSEAAAVAERIRRAVESTSFSPTQGVMLRLTVSIGGVTAGATSTTTELRRIADNRLYEAKRAGRNNVVLGDELAPLAA